VLKVDFLLLNIKIVELYHKITACTLQTHFNSDYVTTLRVSVCMLGHHQACDYNIGK
jgi:hypothetical protein